jgi:hypothetical protein
MVDHGPYSSMYTSIQSVDDGVTQPRQDDHHSPVTDCTAIRAANWLRRALADHGIDAAVFEGDRVALVSVWADLVVWCECGPQGWQFRWWSGRVSDHSGRWVWSVCPAGAGRTAARRIAERYREVRASCAT